MSEKTGNYDIDSHPDHRLAALALILSYPHSQFDASVSGVSKQRRH